MEVAGKPARSARIPLPPWPLSSWEFVAVDISAPGGTLNHVKHRPLAEEQLVWMREAARLLFVSTCAMEAMIETSHSSHVCKLTHNASRQHWHDEMYICLLCLTPSVV